ncbi:glycosyltransferase [Kineococcus sp. NPDC059986]|uniref:glycosyltransferase n=1 Tax=Kineococcus sp. NPDC059986 TaxID=3155538 RepID=UPI00344DBBCD
MKGSDASAVDVFLNVQGLSDNPYPARWAQAWCAAGATVRPFSLKQLVRHRAGGRGWVDLQWPEWVLNGGHPWREAGRLLLASAVARLVGHRVVLTVHNIAGHDVRRRRAEKGLWAVLGALATHVHCFTRAGAEEFLAVTPTARRARVVVIPHGHYRDVVGQVPSSEHSRSDLGVPTSGEVVTLFGKLKAYKGVSTLVDALAGCDASAPVHLLLAGAPADEETRTYLAGVQRRTATTVLPRYLSQSELTAAIAACDLVVLPYARVTNSGSALMALSVGRPVLLPRTPVFEELQTEVGREWVHLYDGQLDGSDVEHALADPAAGRPDLSWCDWEEVTVRLAELMGTRPTVDVSAHVVTTASAAAVAL